MRRGRKARQAAPPAASAVRPGLPGARYRPLTQSDEQQIHRTVLDVLENIGMADPIPVVEEHALARGCFMNEQGRLCFPRALVEDVIANSYRPSTLPDVYDAARLVDRMDNVHAFSRLVVATEIQDQLACDVSTAYASVAGTSKHTALTFNDASHVQPTLVKNG